MPTKRSDGRWQTFVELGKDSSGKRNRLPIYGKSSGEAKAKKAEMQAEIAKGNFSMPSGLTVSGYIDKWMDIHKANVEQTTAESYKYNISHIKKHLGDKRVQELKPIDIQRFYSDMLVDHSPNTIKKIHVLLNKALDMALKSNIINHNPASAVDVPKKVRFNSKIVKQDKFNSLMQTISGTVMGMSVILAGLLGLRKGEVLALKWSDIDGNVLTVQRSLARVPGKVIVKEPKNDSSKRKILIQQSVLPLLEKHKKWQFQNRSKDWTDNGLVVCQSNGKWIRPDNFSARFKKLFAKGEEIRFHDLRHYNATMMLKLGISDKMAAARLGHKQVATLNEIYQHVLEDMEKDAADKLNGLYKS
jgi:integrase